MYSETGITESTENKQIIPQHTGQELITEFTQNMQQNIDRTRGRSIKGTVCMLRLMNLEEKEICLRLMESFHLSREEAESFLQED